MRGVGYWSSRPVRTVSASINSSHAAHLFHADVLVQRIRLIRKLAPVLNGVDLSRFAVGDEIVVPEATAAMLVREGWADLIRDEPKPIRQNNC